MNQVHINNLLVVANQSGSQPKPLVLAIRMLIAGGFVISMGTPKVYAEVPVPMSGHKIGATPVDIATIGHATAALKGAQLNILQKDDKVTLDWKSFNIGAQNGVNFVQPSATSVALNRIHDLNPSQIMGTLKANGQVYLINQNGFVFGKDSQVNVNTLVATTLGISDDTFKRGITKVFDITNSAAFEGNGQLYLKNDQGKFVLDQKGQKIKIQIFLESGASIKTQGEGGRVIIAAPTVTNAGTIQTPNGQTLLVGSQDKVYLQEAGSNSNIRGLLVEVGTGGEVNNVGKVLAERGNVSLMGFAVNQVGVASASTSVRLNGSVRLLAREGVQSASSTGGKLLAASTVRSTDHGDGLGTSATVNLAGGSLTRVGLDADKKATAIDAQKQTPSSIEISGHHIILRNKSTVQAKSGDVVIAALDNPANASLKGNARIQLEAGSKIDVSGVKNLRLPVSRNVVEVELRKNELKDSPLQRDGIIFGKKVSVDLRNANLTTDASSGNLVGASIPVADIKGAVDRIARNIDERSTSGGAIELKSSGDVVTKAGSQVDFSGGSLAYQSSVIKTTQVISDGRILDITKADPDKKYTGIVNGSHLDAGYIDGKAGGSLKVSAYEARLDGKLSGQTTSGILQRTADQREPGSSLVIDLSNNNLFGKQDIVIGQSAAKSGLGLNESLPRKSVGSNEPAPLILNAGFLKSSGVRNADIKTNGSILIQEGAKVELADNAKLSLSAVGLDVLGSIYAPAGEVSLQPVNLSGSGLIPSHITIGKKSVIDVSGLWVNDWQSTQVGKGLSVAAIEGGKVNLTTEQGDLRLEKGSKIDVSSGVLYQADGKLKEGGGGSIELNAATHDAGGKVSTLFLGGELAGWGLTQGGNLKLNSNEVLVGSAQAALHPNVNAQPLYLSSGFFNQGGFGSFDINSNYYGLKVADNVHLNVFQRNVQLNDSAHIRPTGSHIENFSTRVTLPENLRKPVDLKLSLTQLAGQNRQQALSIGKGAVITTDPQSNLELSSDTSIFVNGTLNAPAGNIALTINTPSKGDTGFFANQGIWLGADSQLLAKGAYLADINRSSLKTGEVLPGGNVNLTANRGYIVTDASSLIDTSGTATNLDLIEARADGGQTKVVSRLIASEGGTINLKAGEGMLVDGNFKTKGGAGAAGGTLAVELSGGLRNKPEVPVAGGSFPDDKNVKKPRAIEISSNTDSVIPVDLAQGGVIDSSLFNGRAFFNDTQLNSSKAGVLSLKLDAVAGNDFTGSILFNGDVQLEAGRQITLDAPVLKTIDGQVGFNTSYAVLGSSQSRLDTQLGQGLFTSRLAPDSVAGGGQFNVNAQGVDLVGGLSFEGFGTVNLNSQGDVRAIGIRGIKDTRDFLGVLNLAGDLNIKSSQIYPATLTDYTINLTGKGEQTVTIQNSGKTAGTVLSAGGGLTINAANIIQRGTVKVPFGSLTLNASNKLELARGSLTSVSGNGSTVPFGQVSGGINWLYPFDSTGAVNLLVNTPPEKRLKISGRDIAMSDGAKVDLSGGGDLHAYEFIPGPGGSKNVLDPNATGFTQKFAVLPNLGSSLTPYDPLSFSASGLHVGDSVYLTAGSGLKAGWYNLLPANYALLPGAYLVTPQQGTKDFVPGQVTTNYKGETILAGRYGVASAKIQNDRWQAFAVESGAVARTRSEFKDYSANQFFADKASKEATAVPQLARDAGSLSIAVENSLALGAKLLAAPTLNGLGGQVDISANKLAIVGLRQDIALSPEGTVSLLDADLNTLKAPSLLLGGVRSKDKKGEHIKVATQNLTIDGNSHLKGQEILLAARDQVKVSSGAVVESSGKNSTRGIDLLIDNQVSGANQPNSDGALLRVSASNQADIIRDKTVTGKTGILVVEQGARLKAGGSMTLDSTRNTVFDGNIDMQGGSLSLKSSRISLGNAPVNTQGLVLKNTRFTLDELKLASTSDFDIYGNIGINTKRLEIDAANINGFNSATDKVSIAADSIKLMNTSASSNATGSGSGELTLTAKDTLELGGGNYAINGFHNISLQGTKSIKGLGQVIDSVTGNSSISLPGILKVGGDLNLSAGQYIGDNGATTSIDATGHQVSLATLKTASVLAKGGLGARWSISGDSIASNARFNLLSGILELKALKGDVDLNAGSLINVAGEVMAFGGLNKASTGGNVILGSNTGAVNLAQGATINLAGAAVGNKTVSNAGSLEVSAKNASFNWNGDINAEASSIKAPQIRQGKIKLDVNSFGKGGFSALNKQLVSAGFTDDVYLRQRSGDISLALNDKVQARSFSLLADQGKVTVNGLIDVGSPQAGSVSIAGRNGIVLASTGKINAASTAAGAGGGSVFLDTVHGDDAGSGLLNLAANGGLIDVSGGKGGVGGAVHLRTGRDSVNNAINVSAINTSIVGADPLRTNLEATRVYDGQSVINNAKVAVWQTDTAGFMNNLPLLANASGSVINVLPGIEVRGQKDLTLADQWDLINWRYNDATANKTLPGYLTLNAGNNLNINASLTDAFATDALPGQPARLYQDMLQPGLSWSYNLIAGNNVNLASSYLTKNPLAPTAVKLVKSQVVVRTGTGAIDINAGKNIAFVKDAGSASSAAAVYTIGTAGKYTKLQLLQGLVPGVPPRVAGETDASYLNRLDPVLMDELLRFGYLDETRIGNLFQKAEFPTQGGNVNLHAGVDIAGINTGQKISDWLVRSGTLTEDNKPTLWGINISGDRSSQTGNIPTAQGIRTFNQNVGALGGGNVSVEAGGNVTDLSVMIPTTGKPLGTLSETPNQWLKNTPAINGGGDLLVTAGNDITGGEYFTGKGTASLTAGGSIANSAKGLGGIFELGDSQYTVQARKDVNIGSVYNPTLLKQAQVVGGESKFFTYGANSAINFSATAGNIVFQNSVDPGFEYSVYPGTVAATAFSGDIGINKSMTLYPAAQGFLHLFANNNITSSAVAGQNVNINVSDADVTLLPNATAPVTTLEGSLRDGLIRARERLDPTTPLANIIHAVTPVHQDNATKTLVMTKQGDIAFTPGSQVTFFVPTASEFIAGRDVSNLSLSGQNLFADDITRIQAGRDITFNTQINSDGVVLSNDNQIQLGGSGQLQVVAGRDINLGASAGIKTIGNIYNPVLGSSGATISIAAGLSDKVDYAGFIKKYEAKYKSQLQGLGQLSENQKSQVLEVLLKVLFDEIKQSASAAAAVPETQRKAFYQRGFDAIATLFPGNNYAGDLSLVFSQIKTLDGGDINVLAPGGKIDVGLAGQLGSIRKTTDQLGMIVQQQGALNALSQNDFSVNQSRVFTLGGGDIVVWSSKGSIDAGKGAKSAIAAPPPVTSVDEKGNIVTIFPPVVSGSGIQTIGNGQVTLAAPVGVVDAGEAGISGGRIVIAATAVIGASNITSTSGTVGVPTTVSAPVNLAGANSAAASATKSASQSTDNENNKKNSDGNANKKSTVSILTSDVIGYGKCSVGDVKDGKDGCGG